MSVRLESWISFTSLYRLHFLLSSRYQFVVYSCVWLQAVYGVLSDVLILGIHSRLRVLKWLYGSVTRSGVGLFEKI